MTDAGGRRPGWELAEVVAELRDRPWWGETQAVCGPVMAATLRFLGWSDDEIGELLGVRPEVYEVTRPAGAEGSD